MTRVLIIEDEESYREATAFMLRKEGFEVNTAAMALMASKSTRATVPTSCCSTS